VDETRDVRFEVAPDGRTVSGILRRPAPAVALLVLGHGAGAGMRHRFMEGMAEELAIEGIATLRYQFPYAESGRRRPDRAPLLVSTVRSAVRAARELAPDLPLLAGGKSPDDVHGTGGSPATGRARDRVLRLSPAPPR
jgi:predicted alpha/beta-hydrolase family hydrolase